jgi:ketosteroid isomerase-like protein
MRRFIGTLALACAACSATGSRPETPAAAVDPSPRRAHEAYVAAINSNDVDAVLDMLSADVVLLVANHSPVVGKDAVKLWVADHFDRYRTRWEKSVEEYMVFGEWAFGRYSWRTIVTPKAGGSTSYDKGWGLIVYHHDADGRWRVARDAWSADHPPPSP